MSLEQITSHLNGDTFLGSVLAFALVLIPAVNRFLDKVTSSEQERPVFKLLEAIASHRKDNSIRIELGEKQLEEILAAIVKRD